MKIPQLFIRQKPKKKLRASTARRSMAAPEEMDYEEMSEPNMKLSRALLIVLVLHVVAVAGTIAFNAIKSRQGAFPAQTTAKAQPAETATAAPLKAEPVAPPAASLTNAQKTTTVPAKAGSEPSAIPRAQPPRLSRPSARSSWRSPQSPAAAESRLAGS